MSKDIKFDFLKADARYPGFDFASYLEEKDLEFRKMDSGDHVEWAINCPSCVDHGEPTPDMAKKLWVNLEIGKFHCYRCKWSGPLTRLVEKLSNVQFPEALKILRGEALDPMEHLNLKLYEETYDFSEDEEELHEIEMPYGYEPIEGPHPYLKQRDIPWRYARDHEWGISKAGFTKDRLIVPTFMEGRLVYWQARATWETTKKERKVLNPKGVSARGVLFNYDIAKKHDVVVLTEGFIDAVKVGEHAMATNGKKLHAEQLEWLKETRAKKIILAYDNDAWTDAKRRKGTDELADGASCSIKKAVDLLRVYFRVKVARFPDGRDAGSYPYQSDDLRRILKAAKTPRFEHGIHYK